MNEFSTKEAIVFGLILVTVIPAFVGFILMGLDWIWDFEIQHWNIIRIGMFIAFISMICGIFMTAVDDEED